MVPVMSLGRSRAQSLTPAGFAWSKKAGILSFALSPRGRRGAHPYAGSRLCFS